MHSPSCRAPGVPTVATIFFGGGTPSLMQGASVAAVLDTIARLWRAANDVEITLESNPASADAAALPRLPRGRREPPVARRSGAERCRSENAGPLARCRGSQGARLRWRWTTFDRVSLDLIYARPGQTRGAMARGTDARRSAFGTEHLSLYQLTIEPATPFATLAQNRRACHSRRRSCGASLYELTQEMTEAAGLPAYEISNHARPGAECRHNLLYWRYGDYAGVGPGAHGRLTLNGSASRPPASACRNAGATGRSARPWLRRADRNRRAADAAREHLLMNLRLSEGLDLTPTKRAGALRSTASASHLLGSEGLVAHGARDRLCRDAARPAGAQQRDRGAGGLG